ncbi:MAG: ice-binding family protein [Methanoregula sp.]
MLNSTKKSGRTSFSLVITVALMCLMTAAIIPGVMGVATDVDLGTAANFAILSKTGITDVPLSTIVGNIGASPITAVAIQPTCPEITGTVYGTDATYAGGACYAALDVTTAPTAVSDMETAYTTANGQVTAPIVLPGSLSGLTLAPGLYKTAGGVLIPGDVTLDAQGDATAVWVFQIGGTLDISANKKVILAGGAQPDHIYWVVAGDTTLGANSIFNGNILDQTLIAMGTGATLNGRALAQTAVTMDHNIVNVAVLRVGPVANFALTNATRTVPNTVRFTDGSTKDSTATLTWAWDFDNNGVIDSTLQSPLFTYNAVGVYTSNLTVTDSFGAVSQKLDTVTVYEAPVADFTFTNATGTVPNTVRFTDASTKDPSLTISSWAWDFDNNGVIDSTIQSPLSKYNLAGVFTPNLTVTDSSGAVATKMLNTVTVYQAPVADFTFTNATGTVPNTVRFTDASTKDPSLTISSWAWDFENNGIIDSTVQSPLFTYSTVGIYTTNLTVTDSFGAVSQKLGTVTVNSAVGPTITGISPASGPTAGGTIVTITGTNLASTTGVTIDGLAVAYTVISATSIKATTTAHAAGSVNIVVTTPDGTATGSGATGYTYGSATAVNLGTAGNFVILSKAGITDVPTSDIRGNIGTSPITGASITGLGCPEVTGIIYTVDATGPACRVVDPALLGTAVTDMEAAYIDAAGQTPTDYLNAGSGELGGLTLAPGLYTFTTDVTVSTDVTLSGGPNSVWVFQIPGTLDISSGKHVILSGGAQKQNIFWQVAGVTTLGTTSVFEGTILSQTKIALQTGASLNGRALAQTEVTLDSNKINVPAPTPVPVINYGAESEGNTNNPTSPASPVASGQLAPILPSLITPVIGAGSIVSIPFVADITDMPGVAVSWATVIDDAPAMNSKVTTAILPNVDQSTLNALITELNRGGLDISNLAYGMAIQQTGVNTLSPTHVSMSASQSWVTLSGGRDNIRIIGIANDGTTEVLNTWYDGYDHNSGYLIFKATSIQSGLGTSYWLVAVKPYTPAPATISIEPVTMPISSPVAPVSSIAPGTGQMAPTQAPATTTSTSTGIPIILVGGILAALVLIGVGVITYTRRNK